MSSAAVQAASRRRRETRLEAEVDKRIELLLDNAADHYHAVTADPQKMGHLRFLLKHYAKDPHPWRACVKDNTKRFGPERVKHLCGVLKDIIRQSADWRGHPDRDHGAPGVGIAEADAPAAHGLAERQPSLLDELDMKFGVVDHSEIVAECLELLCDLGNHCDIYRVLIGLDEPPAFEEAV